MQLFCGLVLCHANTKSALCSAVPSNLTAEGAGIVTTNNFRLELEKVNHVWPLEECNRWIKLYQPFFFEVVTDGGEHKTWALRNMGYVR